MNKTEKIRQIYAIVIGVFVVAMGIALICVAADIYYSGRGTGVIFTREIVSERLQAMAIPFIILIGAIAVGCVFPLYEVRPKRKSEDGVRLLSKKMPSGGSGEEYEAAVKNYKSLNMYKLIVWCVTGAVILGCTIGVLCYLLDTANFLGEDITGEIFGMVKNILPCIAVSFVVLVAATIVNGVIASRQLKELKTIVKTGNGVVEDKSEMQFVTQAKKALLNNITLWAVRGIVFVVAVTFIVLGIVNGGAHDVMVKAINICTECIGLG